MSDNFYEDESNAMRVLREKAEADSKTIREMAERLQKMEEKETTRAREHAILKAGLDPKVSALIPKDADPAAWLKENGDLFARKQVESTEESLETGDEPPAPDAHSSVEAQAIAAIAAAAKEAPPSPPGLQNLEAQIKAADSPEAIQALLAKELGNLNVQF